MAQFNPLRPVVERLTSTPPDQLPSIALFLASSIANCSENLRTAPLSSAAGGENAVFAHRLKTKISSLLQDRSPEARFTAVILVKAFVEAAGRDALESSEPWLRSLLTLLGRPGPTSHKKLCLITITRIFLLTQPYQTLVREITTPLLPGFTTTCLNLIKPHSIQTSTNASTSRSLLLEPVLRCLLELIPYHPSTLRPFISRIEPILLSLIVDSSIPSGVSELACQLLATLHFCAPKKGASTDWARICTVIISSCHRAADVAFTPVIEDWKASQYEDRKASSKKVDVETFSKELNGLFPLKLDGIHHAASGVKALLKALRKLISGATAQTVAYPVGPIIDLSFRITSVRALSEANGPQFPLRLNSEVGRDERESLWTELPSIHLEVLNLLSAMFDSCAQVMRPVAGIVIHQAITIFNSEKRDANLRTATYNLLHQIFSIEDSLINKSDMKHLKKLVTCCCAELLPEAEIADAQKMLGSSETAKAWANGSTSMEADLLLKTQRHTSKARFSAGFSTTYLAASRLLPCFIAHLRPGTLTRESRTEIDRTSILVQNRESMLASVLNPPPLIKGHSVSPSIMPFLAREIGGNISSEALLRPRMPVIRDTEFVPEDSESDSEEHTDNTESIAKDSKENGLLEQLEYATDTSAMEGNYPVESEKVPTTTMFNKETVNHRDSIPVSPLTTKRAFSAFAFDEGQDMTGTAANGARLSRSSINEDSIKKQRLEADNVISSPYEMQEKSGGDRLDADIRLAHENGQGIGQVNPASQRTEPVSSRISDTLETVSAAMMDADDDESDFEIPAINPELSTDDEGEGEHE